MRIENAELNKFLRENAQLLKENSVGLSKLYEKAQYRLYHPGNLTKLLYDAGIDVIKILGHVPAQFMYNLTGYMGPLQIPEGTLYIGEDAFRGLQNWEFDNFNIPGSVKRIHSMAFENSYISDITLNEGLISIGKLAFAYTILEKITIPDSVKYLDNRCFFNCYYLEKVNLGKNIQSLDLNQFEGCSEIQEVFYNGSVEKFSSIYKNAFKDCYKLNTVKCLDGEYEVK